MECESLNIKRGDIYYADLSPVVGSEQGGLRPVLIIQNDVGNRYSPTVIAAAITSKMSKTHLPTHIDIYADKVGLQKDSVILLEQIRTIDKQRLKEKMGHLSDRMMAEVDEALSVSFGLSAQVPVVVPARSIKNGAAVASADGITVQAEQVPETSETTEVTAFVGEVSKTEIAVEIKETTVNGSEVVTEEPKVFTEEKTPTEQETVAEECTEIAEETVVAESEEAVECIDKGDQSLVEYKPQIGGQPNPFENDTPVEIDDRPVEDYVGEGEDRPGEGKHF